MARTLDLSPRKKTPSQASSVVPMEPITTSLERDVFLASISVVPAAILWIAFDHLYLGILMGGSIFITAEYILPAYRAGTLDLQPLIGMAQNLRSVIRTRVARGA